MRVVYVLTRGTDNNGCITGDEDKPPRDIAGDGEEKNDSNKNKKINSKKKKKVVIIKAPAFCFRRCAAAPFSRGVYNIMQMGPLPDGKIRAEKERVVGMSTYLNTNTNRMQIKMPSPVFLRAVPIHVHKRACVPIYLCTFAYSMYIHKYVATSFPRLPFHYFSRTHYCSENPGAG